MAQSHPRVFVTKLDNSVDETMLHEFFSRWCEVRQVWIVRDKATGISRNFGFVELADADSYGAALELSGYLWHDRAIVVKPARQRDSIRATGG